MGAFLRIELFPSNLQDCIDFYTKVLRFRLLRQEEAYAYLQRDSIFIGAVSDFPQPEAPAKREQRRPPVGVEIVVEVDDLQKERDLVVAAGWRLDSDLQDQYWGLRDFRICDPDGYYLRITEHSPGGKL